jgi:hypothetical protein
MKRFFMILLVLLMVITSVPCALVISASAADGDIASEDERAPQQEVGQEGLEPVYASDLQDGTYDIQVESSSSMFRIDACKLTVDGDHMTAVMTLGGTGYLKLYMGTGEQAAAASEEDYAEYQEDAEGAYTYQVDVEALNTVLECTGYSKRKEKWYDHQIFFLADTLPREAFAPTAYTAAQPARLDLADGSYTVAVTMTGGSGKATVESPAAMTVTDGQGVATLRWSSPNYDYMIVGGEQYLPVNTGGNSVFEIPVLTMDEPFPVIGDTTAMSQPHEVAYELTFDSASVQMEKNSSPVLLIAVIAAAVVVVAALVLTLAIRRKKKA